MSAIPTPTRRGFAMTTGQIRFFTLWRREINRFMKIKKQTIGAPLLETFLYISVFGAALGTRIDTLHGFKYVTFVVPGLIMMAWAMNSFSNNASSILQQKFQGAIQDQLSSPASPMELLTAFSLGGFTRGLVVAVLTFIAAALLIDLPVEHILVLIPGLFLVGFFFGQLGVLIGVRAEQFDDVSVAQTFVLTPLIFLGGVFYSASLLPEPWQTLTHFNPVYYMINLVRYGFLGYSEASIALSLLALAGATIALFYANLRLFQRGYKLRASLVELGDDLSQPDRVGEDVDLDDPPAADRERAERQRAALAHHEYSSCTVDDHGPPVGRQLRELQRPRGDVLGPANHGRELRPGGAGIDAEDDVGVEDCEQGVEVAVAGGGANASTTSRWAARPTSGSGAWPRTRRRARLASWRAASGERSTIGAISSNGTPNMSWRTNESRSAGVSVSMITKRAMPTESASSASCSGSSSPSRATSGSGTLTSGCSARDLRERSMSRQTRPTTVVSQPPGFSIEPASARLSRNHDS